MTSTDPHPRRRGWRWLRRLAIGLVVVVALVNVGGWLRGQAQWGPFSGQLVDEETGAPIAGAHVMVSWDRRLPTPTGDGGRSFLDAVETVTNSEGRFELAGRPRYWELFARDPRSGHSRRGIAHGARTSPRRTVCPLWTQPSSRCGHRKPRRNAVGNSQSRCCTIGRLSSDARSMNTFSGLPASNYGVLYGESPEIVPATG